MSKPVDKMKLGLGAKNDKPETSNPIKIANAGDTKTAQDNSENSSANAISKTKVSTIPLGTPYKKEIHYPTPITPTTPNGIKKLPINLLINEKLRTVATQNGQKIKTMSFELCDLSLGQPVLRFTNIGSPEPGTVEMGIRPYADQPYVITIYKLHKESDQDFIYSNAATSNFASCGIFNTHEYPNYFANPLSGISVSNGKIHITGGEFGSNVTIGDKLIINGTAKDIWIVEPGITQKISANQNNPLSNNSAKPIVNKPKPSASLPATSKPTANAVASKPVPAAKPYTPAATLSTSLSTSPSKSAASKDALVSRPSSSSVAKPMVAEPSARKENVFKKQTIKRGKSTESKLVSDREQSKGFSNTGPSAGTANTRPSVSSTNTGSSASTTNTGPSAGSTNTRSEATTSQTLNANKHSVGANIPLNNPQGFKLSFDTDSGRKELVFKFMINEKAVRLTASDQTFNVQFFEICDLSGGKPVIRFKDIGSPKIGLMEIGIRPNEDEPDVMTIYRIIKGVDQDFFYTKDPNICSLTDMDMSSASAYSCGIFNTSEYPNYFANPLSGVSLSDGGIKITGSIDNNVFIGEKMIVNGTDKDIWIDNPDCTQLFDFTKQNNYFLSLATADVLASPVLEYNYDLKLHRELRKIRDFVLTDDPNKTNYTLDLYELVATHNTGNVVIFATNVGSSKPGILKAGIRPHNCDYVVQMYELHKEAGFDFIPLGNNQKYFSAIGKANPHSCMTFAVVDISHNPDYAQHPIIDKRPVYFNNCTGKETWITTDTSLEVIQYKRNQKEPIVTTPNALSLNDHLQVPAGQHSEWMGTKIVTNFSPSGVPTFSISTGYSITENSNSPNNPFPSSQSPTGYDSKSDAALNAASAASAASPASLSKSTPNTVNTATAAAVTSKTSASRPATSKPIENNAVKNANKPSAADKPNAAGKPTNTTPAFSASGARMARIRFDKTNEELLLESLGFKNS